MKYAMIEINPLFLERLETANEDLRALMAGLGWHFPAPKPFHIRAFDLPPEAEAETEVKIPAAFLTRAKAAIEELNEAWADIRRVLN